jgi:hypothetical protein
MPLRISPDLDHVLTVSVRLVLSPPVSFTIIDTVQTPTILRLALNSQLAANCRTTPVEYLPILSSIYLSCVVNMNVYKPDAPVIQVLRTF